MSALHMLNEDFDATPGLDYGGDNKKPDDTYKTDGVPEINLHKHTNDIKERDLVQLNIDLAQRGVGGDDSWGARPLEKYTIKGDAIHTYSFYMVPFENGSKELFVENFKEYYPLQE